MPANHILFDADAIVAAVLSGVRDALPGNVIGVYLRGSLAMGDFLETSDVDLLVVTERRVSQPEFAALLGLHARLEALPNPYAQRFEVAYIDRDALRRFRPGEQHPTLGQGETLQWTEHFQHWILERWMVREHGVTLIGPEPQSIIDAIEQNELRAAVRSRLRDWASWARQPDNPEELPRLGHLAYVVETMCRVLYTLTTGDLASKPRAVAWALAALPPPWRDLVQESQSWRADRTPSPDTVPLVLSFVLWTDSEGESALQTSLAASAHYDSPLTAHLTGNAATDERAALAAFAREGLTPHRWSNGPGDTYAAHSHPYHKVLYCLHGSITFILEAAAERIELRSVDRLDIEPGTVHSAIVGPHGVECAEAARDTPP